MSDHSYIQVYLDADGNILHIYHDENEISYQALENDDRIADVQEFYVESDEDDPENPGKKKKLDAAKLFKHLKYDPLMRTVTSKKKLIKNISRGKSANKDIRNRAAVKRLKAAKLQAKK